MDGGDEDDAKGGDDAEEPADWCECHGGGFEEGWPVESCGEVLEEDFGFGGAWIWSVGIVCCGVLGAHVVMVREFGCFGAVWCR